MPTPDHVTWHARDDKGSFTCQRCGQTHHWQLPMDVQDWVKMSKAFMQLHKFCKPTIAIPFAAGVQPGPETKDTL